MPAIPGRLVPQAPTVNTFLALPGELSVRKRWHAVGRLAGISGGHHDQRVGVLVDELVHEKGPLFVGIEGRITPAHVDDAGALGVGELQELAQIDPRLGNHLVVDHPHHDQFRAGSDPPDRAPGGGARAGDDPAT